MLVGCLIDSQNVCRTSILLLPLSFVARLCNPTSTQFPDPPAKELYARHIRFQKAKLIFKHTSVFSKTRYRGNRISRFSNNVVLESLTKREL